MKIAICTLSQSIRAPGGLLSWFSQIAQFLPEVDQNTDYHFIVSEETREYVTGRSPKVTADLVGWDSAHRFLRLLSEHVLIGAWLRHSDIDVLFVANAGIRPLYLPRNIAFVQGMYGLQHLDASDIKPAVRLYRNLFFRPTVRRADAIIVNSEFSKALLCNAMPAAKAKVVVVRHGLNDKLFHDGPLTEEEKSELKKLAIPGPHVAFISQIYPYKNVHTAVDGFCRFVVQNRAPSYLIIVGSFNPQWGGGEAYRQRLIEIARSYGLAERLMFYTSLSVKALRALYVSGEAYIQPSLSETFGRTTVEAMACGCPIVAARAGATPEIAGDAALYFDREDAEGCANALLRLKQDTALRRDQVRRGIERARHFSIRDEAQNLARVFTETVVNRKRQ